MFVMSKAQARALLQPGKTLLDVGAGDGNTTQNLAPLFLSISATELSDPMLRRLLARLACDSGAGDFTRTPRKLGGYTAYRSALLEGIAGPFDCISCLNVLDRCSRPVTLMAEMKARLRPGGQLLLAIVLPFSPFVENGNQQAEPEELLEPTGRSFNAHLQWFAAWFIASGWRLQRVARLPYLSAGDTTTPYYVLSDAVFVLTHEAESAPAGAIDRADEQGGSDSKPPPLIED